jgi:hypothetical protein
MSKPNSGSHDPHIPGFIPSSLSPQARAKAERLIAIRGTREAADLGFIARAFLVASLPHRDPGPVETFTRHNGRYTFTVRPGPPGVPYGTYPRLLLAWMSTAALRQNTRHLALDTSIEAFMSQLGLTLSGGPRGTRGLLQKQMKRLLATQIEVDEGPFAGQTFRISTYWDLWWDARRPTHPEDDEGSASDFTPTVTLGKITFHEMRRHPIPFDMRVLRAVKQSPLAIDLYLWLTYRVSYLKRPTEISWSQLHNQLGADYSEVKQFARSARQHLETIRVAWPELNYKTPYGRLRLHPCTPHISS